MDSSTDRNPASADAPPLDLAEERLRVLGGEDLRKAAHGLARAHADRRHPGRGLSDGPWAEAFTRSLMRTADAVEHGQDPASVQVDAP